MTQALRQTHLRMFVAAKLSTEIVEQLRSVVANLRRHLPDARWARPEDMHMTLAFLGKLAEDRLDGVRHAMNAAVQGKASFQIALGGLGAFPNWKNPRVVWLGVAQGAPELGAIEKSLREELVRRSFKLETRPYHPHLTLCRLRSGQDLSRFKGTAEPLFPKMRFFLSMRVESIDLIQSRLTSDGPLYTVFVSEELLQERVA